MGKLPMLELYDMLDRCTMSNPVLNRKPLRLWLVLAVLDSFFQHHREPGVALQV